MNETTPALLPEMAPGGMWMAPLDGSAPPAYVVQHEHQQRLLTRLEVDGGPWHKVADPRDPHLVRQRAEEAALARELEALQAEYDRTQLADDMRAQIAALKAQLTPTTKSRK